MTRLVNWLSSHRAWNIFLLILYFILVVAPHKRFGTFVNEVIFKGIPRDDSNFYILIGALVILAIYVFVFVQHSLRHQEQNKLWFYMVVNVLLAITVLNLLFVNNVEVIHFPQYAAFAILLFPLIGNYTATLIWATLAGAVDEAYQYFYLAPFDTSYYDLNDVVTNLIGVVFGILLLRSLGIAEQTMFKIKSSTIWIGLGAFVVTTIILHVSGILSIYPDESRPYHILREWPPGFWTTDELNVTYHVIRPLEGLFITCGLWLFYARLSPKSTQL